MFLTVGRERQLAGCELVRRHAESPPENEMRKSRGITADQSKEVNDDRKHPVSGNILKVKFR